MQTLGGPVRILAACTTICLLASWHIAQAQTNPAQVPKGPQDKSIPSQIRHRSGRKKSTNFRRSAVDARSILLFCLELDDSCRVRSARQTRGLSNRGLDAEA